LAVAKGSLFRRALFQIHLWTGIVAGLYVVAICVSGSIVVFRNEFYNYFRPGTTVVPRETPRMSEEEVADAVRKAYPGFEVGPVSLRRNRNASADVYLKKGDVELHRLFDPYDGADLGDAEPRATILFEKVATFHDNLLGDRVGRTVNGVGGAILAIMSVTGMIIWWPGIANWRRGLTVRWKTSWKRFNWDLHSAMGFWTFAFVFMWALTSVYMVFPDPFLDVVDFLQPPSDEVPLRSGDLVLEWFARLHIGRFAGMWVKVLWGVIGLIPPLLFVTGVIMWWNRKMRGWIRSEEGPYSSYLKTFFKGSV
jgi:uncharacterized iron-regulated membrane protein